MDAMIRLQSFVHRTSLLLAMLLVMGGAFVFWKQGYVGHLYYQEQLQLFQDTSAFWLSRVGLPGGVCQYVAEFLTQFFLFPTVGPAVMAGLTCLAFVGAYVWAQMYRLRTWVAYGYALSMVVWLTAAFMDEHLMLTYLVSLLCVWGGVICLMRIGNPVWRFAVACVALPLLYWLAGGLTWVAVCAVVISLFPDKGFRAYGRAAILILLTLLVPCLSYLHFQMPLIRFFIGLDYYRFPLLMGNAQMIFTCILLLSPCFCRWFSSTRFVGEIGCFVLLAAGGVNLYRGFDTQKETFFRYDNAVRHGDWAKVIQMAERKSPDQPLTVSCLNLALAQTNQLGERMFQYYQNGVNGLLPDFVRDFTLPYVLSEVYYRLGMTNAAERTSYEAMEAIPNYKKSARTLKRVAEANLINGNYAVAAKFIRMLQHTLFYKDWANEAAKLLYNDRLVAAHPEYGRLRSWGYQDDFLFSEQEKDMMFGLLLTRQPANRMAFEYLMAYELLNKNLELFMKYYPLGKNMGYQAIPTHYQEALVYMWTQTHPNFEGMPWSIDERVARSVADFATHYLRDTHPEPYLRSNYGGTYWYYLLYRK